MNAYLLVALGGAIGSVSRLALANWIGKHLGDSFPWGTVLVNVSGCFLIGALAVLVDPNVKPAGQRLFLTHFLMIGLCGGYTTFSSFSLQTLTLIQAKHYLAAGANVLLSVALCLAAVAIGHWLGSLLLSGKG